jgi:hypothetical protein
MVVGFNLKGQIVSLVKGNDPRVINEGRTHPLTIEIIGRFTDIGGQQPINLLLNKRTRGVTW